MKKILYLITVLILISSCGKKSEQELNKKDSTSVTKDSIKTNLLSTNEKDEPGYYQSNIPFEEYIQKHPNLSKRVEFEELVEMIAINKYPENDKRERLQSWTLLADKNTSPINWLTKGVSNRRAGEVILKFAGKPVEILDKYITPVIWNLTITGSNEGADFLNLDCGELTGKLGHLDIQSLLSKKNINAILLKSTGDPSTGEKDYKINVPNKEPMWMGYIWSCGSGGCTAEFNIYYNENKYKQETEKIKAK